MLENQSQLRDLTPTCTPSAEYVPISSTNSEFVLFAILLFVRLLVPWIGRGGHFAGQCVPNPLPDGFTVGDADVSKRRDKVNEGKGHFVLGLFPEFHVLGRSTGVAWIVGRIVIRVLHGERGAGGEFQRRSVQVLV